MIPKAATVLIVRSNPELEVFMVKRTSKSSFMPDAYVYPGGRLEPDDSSPCFQSRNDMDEMKVAAVRETFEESGFLLVHPPPKGSRLPTLRAELANRSFSEICEGEFEIDRDAMQFMAHWITPVAEPKRFDTYFFLVEAPRDQIPSHDEKETVASLWIRPKNALENHRRGEFLLFPPTYRTLEILAELETVEQVVSWAENTNPTPILPYFLSGSEFPTIVMAGDPEYPEDEAHKGYAPQPKDATRIVLREGAWSTE